MIASEEWMNISVGSLISMGCSFVVDCGGQRKMS